MSIWGAPLQLRVLQATPIRPLTMWRHASRRSSETNPSEAWLQIVTNLSLGADTVAERTISHPRTVLYQPLVDAGVTPPPEYWSSSKDYVVPLNQANAIDLPAAPPSTHFTKVDLDGWDLWGANNAGRQRHRSAL